MLLFVRSNCLRMTIQINCQSVSLSVWTLPWCPCTCGPPSPAAVPSSGPPSSASPARAETARPEPLWRGSSHLKRVLKTPLRPRQTLRRRQMLLKRPRQHLRPLRTERWEWRGTEWAGGSRSLCVGRVTASLPGLGFSLTQVRLKMCVLTMWDASGSGIQQMECKFSNFHTSVSPALPIPEWGVSVLYFSSAFCYTRL